MLFERPRVVIAGLKGGSGKTTLSLGLLRHWRNSGLKVVPFKKGPDYIDSAWLGSAAGHDCHNLDTFIMPQERLLTSLATNSVGADLLLIEGNRGLFDGVDSRGTFSTAALAKLTNSPVILVVDCVKATTTIGVIVKGVAEFDRALGVKAVVLNQIANSRHAGVIKEAIENYTSLSVLGALKRSNIPILPERHMGLVSHDEYGTVERSLESTGALVSQNVDTGRILEIARTAPPLDLDIPDFLPCPNYSNPQMTQINADKIQDPLPCPALRPLRIGLVRDNAFQFYYPENIDALVASGAEIVGISALADMALPPIDALYIGGGFPETQAIKLSGNVEFRRSLKNAVEEGLPVYAECGGLMFLGRNIIYNNKMFPMADIFPMDFVMEDKPEAHGYTIVEVCDDNPFYEKGVKLRGHEFHYSKVTVAEGTPEAVKFKFAFRMDRGKGIAGGMDGLVYKNVLATYTHVHALGSYEWVRGMISAAEAFRRRRNI
ncbi:MAG: cobyrinate a,c-diamide synthase [Nitrospirae bacterium]|nr:cobyrinate a,c-diamide synthase [Nitrospirota bacterium]